MPSPCACSALPDGAPDQWQVVISGVTNNSCPTCTNINGTYILSWVSSCTWRATLGVCTLVSVWLTITRNSDGTVNIRVSLGGGGSSPDHWLISNAPAGPQASYTLTKGAGGTPLCNLPTTITAASVTPPLSDWAAYQACLPAMTLGFPVGGGLTAGASGGPAATFATAVAACLPHPGGDVGACPPKPAGGCGCGAKSGCGCGAAPQAKKLTLAGGCGCAPAGADAGP